MLRTGMPLISIRQIWCAYCSDCVQVVVDRLHEASLNIEVSCLFHHVLHEMQMIGTISSAT